jgi:hypothetical protein
VKRDPFDALVRRRIQEEAFMIHPDFEKRLAQRLADPQLVKSARRVSVRSLALAMALLMLLGGAALATSGWGSRLFLTHEGGNGKATINEELVGLAQPIGEVFEGDALRVEVIDAIYDGQSFTLTWTLQNKQAEGELFLAMEFDQYLHGGWHEENATQVWIKPGETVQSGMTMVVGAESIGETLDFAFDSVVLAPHGERMLINYPGELQGEEFWMAYQAEMARVYAQGGIAVLSGDRIELNRSVYPVPREGVSLANALIDSGKMTAVETVPVRVTLTPSAAVQSLLPDGQPVEKDNGDYILRVTRADSTPGTIHFSLERVFKNREALEPFAPYYDLSQGMLFWWYGFTNADGTLAYSGQGGPVGDPTEQADGTWLWPYQATLTDVRGAIDSITIYPTRDDPETGEIYVPFPEEGLTFTP